jgi:hypothetical protein
VESGIHTDKFFDASGAYDRAKASARLHWDDELAP